MSDCLFCNIAQGSAAAHIVYEDDMVIAFLDTSPIRPGHTQIIPHAHFSYFDELPEPIACRILQAGNDCLGA